MLLTCLGCEQHLCWRVLDSAWYESVVWGPTQNCKVSMSITGLCLNKRGFFQGELVEAREYIFVLEWYFK